MSSALDETDKLVAAILAAGRLASLGGTPSAPAYVDEYGVMLEALKAKAEATIAEHREAKQSAFRRDRESMRAPTAQPKT